MNCFMETFPTQNSALSSKLCEGALDYIRTCVPPYKGLSTCKLVHIMGVLYDDVEAHRCVDTDTEVSLVAQYTTVDNRMFRPEGLC